MTWCTARQNDSGKIASFLEAYIDWAMFPLSNLRAGQRGEAGRYRTRFLIRRVGESITGALGHSATGMLFPVIPDLSSADVAALRPLLAGEAVSGLIGRKDWAHPLAASLGFDRAARQRFTDEPGFALDLNRLRMPDRTGLTLAPLCHKDRALLIGWRGAYHVEILGLDPAKADETAAADIDEYVARGSHRLLLQDGTPVAMTGVNAALERIVQIGGVYTPPALRGRGFARAAVALHLEELHGRGIRRAVLFAASEGAARAYRAIGFEPTGEMTMLLLSTPARIAA
ncbi:GNAT family N-acetyltransferase [Frigidibacter sp. RF13]|uniref:GNAT family N-acetyltransferase n=1 Tax=Frigidibacter sp. RF13 TaxID=2997340 RepID=UPI00227091C4|nr:GNAT family N-acetyltransferase [Frigidibacter sp. RF13]MCY1127728.1 GNAT family N-acetyltransferase [Frigidibacter sp. RF13]